MDPCDPKTNVSVARAAVIDNLLVPSKIVANLTQSELCDLLKTCGTKHLPDPPLMTRPKRVGKFMISIYIRSPLNAKETEMLLRSKPNPTKLKNIAEKLGVFVNGENLKQRILSKLSADGIPEPIKYSATDKVQKNVPVLNNTPKNFNMGSNTPRNLNGGNRINTPRNLNNTPRNLNNTPRNLNNTPRNLNQGNIPTSSRRLTLTPNNFKENQQPQYALPSGKNKRIVAGPWNYARGPSYQIASREQQQLMKQYQTYSNAARYGVPYGGSSNKLMRERLALNQERQKLALNMRKAQQNKELNAKRREFNERVKKLSNMEKQLANKLKAAPAPQAPAPVLPAPVPPADMNKLKRNLANAQKIITELKQKPQNAVVVAKLNNAKARVLVMNNKVAVTQAVTVPKVIEVAKQAKELPEDKQKQVVQQVIANLKPVATTNAQTQYVAKLEKLVNEKKTSEAINSIEKETNVQFNSEKVQKMKNLIGKVASGVASGAKAAAGGASYLYRKVTRTLTIEEKRALLNKLLQNSSVSNANKVKIKAIQNLTNFPKMKSVENVTAYYNKLMKNKNYAEIAAIAEQYGGIRGSLANLRKIGVNKKDERLVELINRFQGANGGAARVSKAANVNRNARLQEVIIELEKSKKSAINRSELEKLLKQFKINPTNVLANVPGNQVPTEQAIAAIQSDAAVSQSLNSGPGSKEAPVSPNLKNLAKRWHTRQKSPNGSLVNKTLLDEMEALSNNNQGKVEKLIEEMKQSQNDEYQKLYKNLMEAYEKSPNVNINKFTQIYANQGKSLNERKKALRNARAFFDKLEVLRSNYNSTKARKGRPGNKVNEKGKPINQLIKNYEQALINLNKQANVRKGTEETYKSKLRAASLVNKKAADSVQSKLLAKINQQGEPTPAMYGVAEIELNNIILKFKDEGEPGKINPSLLAGATNPERLELNKLRRNIRVSLDFKKRKVPNGLNTMTEKELLNILKNLQANNSGSAPMAWFKPNPKPKQQKVSMGVPIQGAVIGRPVPGFGGVNFGNNVNINKKAAHEKLIKELEGELSELPENEVNRAVIRGLFPSENSTNATAARRVMGKARKLLELVKPYQTKLEPKHFKNEQTIDELLKNVQESNVRIKEIQGLRFRKGEEGEVEDIESAIQMLNILPTKRKIPIWSKYRKELEVQLKTLEFNKKFKGGKGGNRNRPKTTVEPRGTKEEGNQPTLPSSLNFRNLQKKAKAKKAFNELVPKGSTGNNGSGTSSSKKGNKKKIKEEGNVSNSSQPLNFEALKSKASKNRANRAKEKEEANRLAKEKANRNEANRVAKEKEEARKKRLKKQLSNSWSKNLNTFGTLNNPLLGNLQSYINGGTKLSENVGKYATNNNPTQHPMLLKRLNSFINSSSSNNGLNLGPVKKLRSQLQLKITQELAEAKKKENARLRAEANLAREVRRAKERAEANEARRVKLKAESNEAIAKTKKNFNSWFNGLSAEDQKALKNLGNMKSLNFARKSLIKIVKDRKLSSIKKIKSSNVRSSENIISYLENENKNVQKAAMNRVLDLKSAEIARYMFINKKDPRLLRLEYLSGQLIKGLNAQQIAQLLKMKEAPKNFKMAMGAVPEQIKPKGGPVQPSPNTNSNIENEGSTETVKKRAAAEKKSKTRVPAPTNQGPKKPSYLQRLGATASVQPQPPTKAVRGKAAQRKKRLNNNNGVEAGPALG